MATELKYEEDYKLGKKPEQEKEKKREKNRAERQEEAHGHEPAHLTLNTPGLATRKEEAAAAAASERRGQNPISDFIF